LTAKSAVYAPQLIPPLSLATVPPPDPAFATLSVKRPRVDHGSTLPKVGDPGRVHGDHAERVVGAGASPKSVVCVTTPTLVEP
jgi:hypothetical protein